MPVSAITAVQTLRSERRLLRHRPLVLRLARSLCGEWRRMLDRAAVPATRRFVAAAAHRKGIMAGRVR